MANGRLSRRDTLRLCAQVAAGMAAVGLARATEDFGDADLVSGPHAPAGAGRRLAESDEAIVYVPGSVPSGPWGLLVLFHGTHFEPASIVSHFRDAAEAHGTILLAPKSCGDTWDVINGQFGPDIRRLDRWLERVFNLYAIEPARLSVAGWSDGGSYALSVGLANGDLFRSIAAFAPGIIRGTRRAGKPTIFVGHGTADQNLKIDETSRVMVPALKRDGYDVTYVEFDGTHVIPDAIYAKGIETLKI